MLIFRLLRSALCEALAQVQAAAALLYLQAPPPRAAAAGGGARAQGGDAALGHAASAGEIAGAAAAAAAAGGEEEEGLFQRTDRLVGASMAAVAAAFRQLDQSVHATLDAQQGPAAPPAADWQVLQAGLSRVLGLHHLRRVFSRLQLQQAGAAAAGAAGEAAAAGGGAEAPPPVLLLPPPPPPPLVPVSTAAALGAARRSVGYTTLLPANATVHSTLQAARRCTRAQRGRRLIEVRVPACPASCGSTSTVTLCAVTHRYSRSTATPPSLVSCMDDSRSPQIPHRFPTGSPQNHLQNLLPSFCVNKRRCRTGPACPASCSSTGFATRPWGWPQAGAPSSCTGAEGGGGVGGVGGTAELQQVSSVGMRARARLVPTRTLLCARLCLPLPAFSLGHLQALPPVWQPGPGPLAARRCGGGTRRVR